MKIAVSGKGGVGKSTVAAAVALLLARRGQRVLALDSDPDANFASALGIPSNISIRPISAEIALIEERTGAKVNEYGKVFKLNPEVGDVADKLAVKHNGVELLVMGAINKGGGGCACPENTFAKALVTDLVLYKNQSLVMDMEAGIEHLGRGTAIGVDVMLIVVEPGQRAVDCARTVLRMSDEIGLKRFLLVGNKIVGEEDKQFIRDAFPGLEIAAFLPYSQNIRAADRDGMSVLDGLNPEETALFEQILAKLESAV
ncbi:MAG: AAA family ATPase [Clostridiales bacterium]|jgi:CO dehydrogenase maturation factor|nr:AAA family ATPase [Clostridiales bacterium]